MNERYATGHPSNDLTKVGVVVHTFDSLADYNDAWTTCSLGQWCYRYSDRFSTSVVNRHLPSYYIGGINVRSTMADAMGGFVLNPSVLSPGSDSIFCAYASDAGTMGMTCIGRSSGSCIPGCRSNLRCQPGNSHYCWWPPDELELMMAAHERRGHTDDTGCGQIDCNYNEVVVNATVWQASMPDLIEAIFFPAGSTRGEARARAVHSAFLRAFGLNDATSTRGPPLVRWWTSEPRPSVFELVQQ